MAPRFHWVKLRATAHQTEDPARVGEALRVASGLDEEAFEAALEATAFDSQFGGEVTMLEVAVTRNRAIRDCFEFLFAEPAVREAVLGNLDARVDDEGTLYLRLDKQAAYGGTLQPGEGDDTVQVKFRIQTHPVNREAALAQYRELLVGS